MMLTYSPARGRYTAKISGSGMDAQKAAVVCKDIPGVSFKEGVVRIPADPRLLEMIVHRWGNSILISQDLQSWYKRETDAERQLVRLLAQEDASLDHPNSSILHPYQRVGVNYLVHAGGGLLCDDMGLGKTVQSIISVDLSKDNDRVLVLCPNAVKHQWREEIERWSCTNPPVHMLEWATREDCMQALREQGGWVIANYYALQRFWVGKDDYATGFDVGTWDWVIIDEGHRLKNRKTRSFRAASLLSFKHLAILTGTPMGNDPSEMWSLLHLLDPEKYSSFWRFFELFVEYIEDPIFGKRTILGAKNPQLLRTDLAPRMVQRRKEDVLPQLPKKQYQTLRLDMDKAQRKYYVQMLNEGRLALENGEELEAWSALAVLVRLRQILSTPANFELPDVSTKLDAVMELIASTSRKVVVYSIYRKTVFSLCKRLDEAGISNVRIIGGMSAEDRQDAQRQLNAAEAQVLVATIKAGGTGLNLQGASTAIFVDEEWNPLEQRQAEDRLHRLGQTETVHIIRLCCPGTVDDLVMEILARKKRMHDAVFEEALQREFDRFLVTASTAAIEGRGQAARPVGT